MNPFNLLNSSPEGLEFLDPSLVVLLPFGTLVGLVAALLGIGGGLLMVPALTIWGATPLQAIATSLVGIVLSSISGTYQNWRMQELNLQRVVLLAPPAMLTTELGVRVANFLPDEILLISFAILQIVAIYLINLKRQLRRANLKLSGSSLPPPPPPPPLPSYSRRSDGLDRQGALVLTQSPRFYTEPSVAELRIFQTQGIGLLAGVLSGLFGVGGGIVMVPLQMLFLKESIKDAIRTSLGAIALISIWAVGRHALSGNVLWLAGLYLGIGGICGAQLGARLLPRLPDNLVNLLFRSLLLLLATYMLIKALMSWSVL